VSTILIGVDTSDRAGDAIAFGRHLASVSSARVIVATAFPYSDTPSRASSIPYRQALHRDAEQTAGAMSDRLEGVAADRVHVRIVANPSPAHALHELAEAEQAELIVVGSSHTSSLGRVVPGSTGERLLHGAPCAVAVVPHGYRVRAGEPFRRIGVAYDGSDEAAAAVAAAVELARALGAQLEVIGVVAPESYSAAAMMGGSIYSDLHADVERCVQESLDALVAGLPADVSAETVRLDGEPAHELAEHSAGLDLMVTGSRGYGPLRSVLVGGVSGRLVRNARCPVLVVPRGADAPLASIFGTAAAARA
jgi:nucleotide-binding universal stress UspA family protein